MPRPVSNARLLTLLCVGALIVSSMTLGAEHAITHGGWIALISALTFNLIRSGHHDILSRQLIISCVIGIGMAAVSVGLRWDSTLTNFIPAYFQGLLAVLVARTLLPGRQPAIERIAAALHPEQLPFTTALLSYLRSSTWLWLGVFGSLSIVHVFLALLHTPFATSELAAFALDFSVIAAVFLLEFSYRRWRHASHAKPGLLRFVMDLRQIDPLNLLLS